MLSLPRALGGTVVRDAIKVSGQIKHRPQNPIYFDIGEPALMIGPRGKVTPMLTQPERHLTVIDEKSKQDSRSRTNGG